MAVAKPFGTFAHNPMRRVFLMGLAAACAVIVGGVVIRSSADDHLAPVMAEQPVVFPDGAKLYVQKYEVSIAEWSMCHEAGACTLALRPPGGLEAATTPATGLSYMDVGEYLTWVNRAMGHDFRLPNVAEWEFLAAEVLPHEADPIFTSPDLTWASAYLTQPQASRRLRAQGSFSSTSLGIVDLDGNVWEWTSECYAGSSEGSISADRCPAFYVAGEHVAAMSFLVRDPARGGCAVGSPPAHLGMRLVSDRSP